MRIDVENRVVPPLKWVGGKSKLLPQVKAALPPEFSRYHEPFVGGGAVFFSVTDIKEGEEVWLSDANPELIEFYEVLRDNPEELMITVDRFRQNHCEGLYYQVRAAQYTTKLDRAARTLYLNKAGFNGLYRKNKKGEFNVPYGKNANPSFYDRENLLRASALLALPSVRLKVEPFSVALRSARAGSVVYCDPPYEPLSPTSSFKNYTGDGFSRADQTQLRNDMEAAYIRGAAVVTSNSSAPFILDLYARWDVKLVDAARSVNSDGAKRGKVKEMLASLAKFQEPCSKCGGYMHAPRLCAPCYNGTVEER